MTFRQRTFGRSFALVGVCLALVACSDSDNDSNPIDPPPPLARELCERLAGETISGATIAATSMVSAAGDVPEYCRVSATIPPKLNFELRLPVDWNGKLHYGGGGGFNGSIPGPNTNALAKGFAQVSSDSGHQAGGTDGSWALDDEQALINFAYQSVPTVTAASREIIDEFYGSKPDLAYFEGCSNGGREALMNAQRFPEVFDGIIARAPAYRFTGLLLSFNRTARALAEPGGTFTPGKVDLLATSVLNACDALDGVADQVVSNLEACNFNPATLRCPNGADAGDSCLSDPQLAVVESYTSDMSLATGQHLNTGWPLTGNENEGGAWPAWVTGNPNANPPAPSVQFAFQEGLVKYMLTKDPALDTLSYSPDSNPAAVLALSSILDASNPDLSQFRASGGKLILWHGASDPAISVNGTTRYYQEATNAAGGQAAADQFMRYYIAPGVLHCAGGPGADQVDLLDALDDWVTEDTAPGHLMAAKLVNGAPTLSRPLCVYPMYPRYNGSGDVNAASSYTCTSP